MRRLLLLGLVGSVAVNAALGVYALVSGEFDELRRDILWTSLAVTGAGLLTLACVPAWERHRVWPLPLVGVAATGACLALLVAALWVGSPPEALSKASGTLGVVAGFCALNSLVALTRLAPRFRWAVPAVLSLSAVLGGMIVAAIWGDWGDDWFARALGIVAVLLAAVTVLLPVFHRASRAELAPVEPSKARAAVSFCPRCGGALVAEADVETRCPSCGARFVVRLRD